MTPGALLAHFLETTHGGYMRALEDLDDEQVHWTAADVETVSIAFHAWHYFRTKDNIVNFVCQDRKPPVWLRQGLPELWGLPKVEQGTGMPGPDAAAIRVPSVPALIGYGKDVHEDVMAYIAAAGEDVLAAEVRVVQFGHQARSQQIMQTCIAHGNGHLGQIYAMRAFQGLDGEGF